MIILCKEFALIVLGTSALCAFSLHNIFLELNRCCGGYERRGTRTRYRKCQFLFHQNRWGWKLKQMLCIKQKYIQKQNISI